MSREDASPWVAAAALAAGGAAARCAIWLMPATGSDVEQARKLGIVSVSILAGHSKSAESLAYVVGVLVALAVSVGLWMWWARPLPAIEPPREPLARPRLFELLAVALVALVIARPLRAHASWSNPWVLYSEEGEALAWVDTVLRGAALSRDVFCLYGPLSTWPVSILFGAFGPSLALWRRWMFALDAAGFAAAWWLARGLFRTRTGAFLAAVVVALVCVRGIPAMSWSLARVGLGLCALGALARGRPLATGALLGLALGYSQEVGVACGVAVGAALFVTREPWRTWAWTASGAALVLVPLATYLAVIGVLGATLDNLFLFPRTRVLGFGGLPFPPLGRSAESLRAYVVPVVLVAGGLSIATKLLRGARDARTRTETALFVFGMLLEASALSRPDDTHLAFAAPPALLLLTRLVEDAALALAMPARRIAGAAGVALGTLVLAPWAPIVGENLVTMISPVPEVFRPLELPRGGGASLPQSFATQVEKVTRELQLRVPPGEPFWVFPNEALFYFLADRPQPTRYPLALFAVTREQRLELVADLERTQPRWVLVNRAAARVDDIPYEVALPELVDYLTGRYEFEESLGSFGFWRRKN